MRGEALTNVPLPWIGQAQRAALGCGSAHRFAGSCSCTRLCMQSTSRFFQGADFFRQVHTACLSRNLWDNSPQEQPRTEIRPIAARGTFAAGNYAHGPQPRPLGRRALATLRKPSARETGVIGVVDAAYSMDTSLRFHDTTIVLWPKPDLAQVLAFVPQWELCTRAEVPAVFRRRSALVITETEDKLIASAAMSGLNSSPVTG
jgi:hypothetical protein